MVIEYFKKVKHHWKVLLNDNTFVLSLLAGILVFIGGQYINHYASVFKDTATLEPVGDLILNRIPVYNLNFLFTWGYYFIILLTVVYPILETPERAPFFFKTFGILLVVRACFLVLTDIGPPEGFFYDATLDQTIFQDLLFRNDLFFSGHTAVPFLAFLLLKGTKFRWFMLFSSFVMGATVILMHVHYSIDVFAAYFITHGIFVLSGKIFHGLNLRFTKRLRLNGWSALKNRGKKSKS